MDLSFWEKDSFFSEIDLLVVGSGIVGLNTARAAKERMPHWRILVIDRGFLPYGASTRNAGFACFGSLSELLDDLTRMPEQDVLDLVRRRRDGLIRLRSLLGDENIGFESLGGYELFTENEEPIFQKCVEALPYFNAAVEKMSGEKNIYKIADEQLSDFGFKGVNHLILNSGEGQIHTGKMMDRLLNLVRSMGVMVLNGIGIKHLLEEANGVRLETSEGFSFSVARVVAATNGFARELMPNLAVDPGRAQVVVTKPIENLKVKGTFHYDKGYYYFRNIGNRILFGGGRNLDFEGEKTTEFALTDLVQNRLEYLLKTTILPNTHFEIEQRWSGIMGLGDTKTTITKRLSPRIFCAVRMGGMGVAIGSLVGDEAAELIVKSND